MSAADKRHEWLAGFRRTLPAAGLDADAADRWLGGLTPDPAVIARDRNQAETALPVDGYLARVLTEERLSQGRAALARHGTTLDRIAAEYGVPGTLLTAIWGVETAYGQIMGSFAVPRALMTLAIDGRRRALFEDQLRAALLMLARGLVAPDRFLGSWAGAFGHMQFMPRSYLDHGVTLDSPGPADHLGAAPGDALASAARLLSARGWAPGAVDAIWCAPPAGLDLADAGSGRIAPLSRWLALGLAPIAPLPASDPPLSFWLPLGAEGPACLCGAGFDALLGYNSARSYAYAVCLLAAGLAGVTVPLPPPGRALAGPELRRLQGLLSARGHDTGGLDGLAGPRTLAAIRACQRAEGLVADGFAGRALLEHLAAGLPDHPAAG